MTNNSKQHHLAAKSATQLKLKKPFWMSSVNYYILTLGITIVSFFIIWGVLHALEEEMPWITAGIASGLILILAVVLREFVFKRAYQKTLLAQRRLDHNINVVYRQTVSNVSSDRLTLERNTEIVREIEDKSKKARAIGNVSELHFEVFELCNEYLRKSNRELEGIHKSSPRYIAIKRGQSELRSLHKFHLLSWASIESQFYVQTAKVQAALNDKIESAHRALTIIDTATQFYPDEENLLQSNEVIKDFIVTIKVTHWIEQAEKSAFKGHYQRAINQYRDALFFLARENERTLNKETLAEEINSKIEELRKKTKNPNKI